ncbi:hypothetical protein Rsub_08604 [Raphidocelis subcapitata]|uniref:t-SNARE coiled-coil homology domain-containing protein n=1 Tax=Raphidocelis subcapitata TaxID=307507 RepID=A0A2V0P9J6_9CHLO|nr:hypothetical protein Rsub_08604 [Raphidocelis subcapitata]|eukprot:GBF95622.1 hypothetical protein Rsub_08604 [Raphidocelis subcapitata]
MAAASAQALLRHFDQEFADLTASIRSKLRRLADEQQRSFSDVDAALCEAEGVVKRAEADARSLPAEHARPLAARAKEARSELAALRRQLEQAAGAAGPSGSMRAELGLGGGGGGGGGGHSGASSNPRDRTLAMNQRLQQTSARLQQGRQQLAEAEATGAQLLSELHRQREVIQGTQQTLDDAGGELKAGEGLLKTMARRAKWFFG